MDEDGDDGGVSGDGGSGGGDGEVAGSGGSEGEDEDDDEDDGDMEEEEQEGLEEDNLREMLAGGRGKVRERDTNAQTTTACSWFNIRTGYFICIIVKTNPT